MSHLRGAILLAIVACRTPVPAVPAAPDSGETPRISATPAADSLVTFMQGMIGHHAQALQMSALVPPRAARPEIRLLAERIGTSQRDEIGLQRWLQARGQSVPADDAHAHAAMGHGHLMPGMLTQPQLDALAAASGPAFDRLFLEGMIRHHEGALTMVAALLASRRNLDAATFRIVSEIDADQRAEIQRMRSLLRSLP